MSDFKGITQDTLFLMQLNRFNDSKAFYEENKEKIKANMTVPMRQIAASLSDMMLDIDPFMNTIPTKMVSRVRRDTRYTHDKHLYRENMWIMFMRPKKEWHMYPCMWFEVTPQAWSCGVGTYEVSADYMEVSGSICETARRASKRLRNRLFQREPCLMPSAISVRSPIAPQDLKISTTQSISILCSRPMSFPISGTTG